MYCEHCINNQLWRQAVATYTMSRNSIADNTATAAMKPMKVNRVMSTDKPCGTYREQGMAQMYFTGAGIWGAEHESEGARCKSYAPGICRAGRRAGP